MARFTGGCRCGKVRFEARGRPYRVGICHCLDCRKHHGALFYAAAVFPGLLLAGMYIVYVILRVLINPQIARTMTDNA